MRLNEATFYVINLRRRPDRLRAIEAQFAGRPNRLVVVEAVDASDPSCAAIPARLPYIPRADRRMTRGEYALALGHAKALDAVAASGEPFAVVIEDDAVVDWQALDRVAVPGTLRFDFLKLQATDFGGPAPAVTVHVFDGGRVEARREFSMGSVAYAVTADSARRMAAVIRRTPRPSDFYLAYAGSMGLAGLEVVAPPVGHDEETASDLEAARKTAPGLLGPTVHFGIRAWLALKARFFWALRRTRLRPAR